MQQENYMEQNETSIDLGRLFRVLRSRFLIIALASILCAIAALIGTVAFITPQYRATSMYYLYTKKASAGITANDIATAKSLVKTYTIILNASSTLDLVIEEAGLDYTSDQLRSKIAADSVSDTEILQVAITSDDPAEAVLIAHAIERVLPERIEEFVLGTSLRVLDTAVTPRSASSPNYARNTIVGLMAGLFASVVVILIIEFANIRIKSEEDILQVCGHPVLATVPNITFAENISRRNSIRNKMKGKHNPAKEAALAGPNINFAATEAYKRLRTMLQFSFADEKSSHVIGVSSALTGEGKSTTAVNLAYTLAQMDKKVILLDCDMRRPSIMNKLRIHKDPGLSNYLTGQCDYLDMIQRGMFSRKDAGFDVISAGRTPPNPIELLCSKKMRDVLNKLRMAYDVVILDLPPAGEVSDAVAVSKMVDGMLLVVRQNTCNRNTLSDVMRQFNYVGAKILGIVFNGASVIEKKYGYGNEGSGSNNKAKQKRYEGKFFVRTDSPQ